MKFMYNLFRKRTARQISLVFLLLAGAGVYGLSAVFPLQNLAAAEVADEVEEVEEISDLDLSALDDAAENVEETENAEETEKAAPKEVSILKKDGTEKKANTEKKTDSGKKADTEKVTDSAGNEAVPLDLSILEDTENTDEDAVSPKKQDAADALKAEKTVEAEKTAEVEGTAETQDTEDTAESSKQRMPLPFLPPTVKPLKSGDPSGSRTDAARFPLEMILPADSAIIFRIASVRKMNERLETLTETNFLKMLKTLGQGEYAKQLDPDRPVGAALFPIQNTFQWTAAVPVKNYRKFIILLGAKPENLPEELPDGTVSVLSETLCAAPYRGHALLAANPMILARVQRGAKFGEYCRYTPCAVKDPTLSLEFTNIFFRFLVQRGRIGMEEFAPVFSPEMLGIQEGSEQMALARQYFDKINDSIAWLDANIASARLDLSVGEHESVLSSSFMPKPETRLAGLIQDPFVPIISTTLDGGSFLKVAPPYPTALCGQVDIPPATAEKLQAPFNRVRHVEYSFITPPPAGRLAEGWCFFLEVNDSDAFVKEMLIPKALEVGEQFGANTMAEIGAEAAQRAAEKRQARQLNRRRPPRKLADPAEAAARGERIGGLIGGLIGGAVAKNEAMKKQDFMGHDLYVSDLVQFTQMKKRIREQQEGTAPPANLFGDGARPSQMIGTLLAGLISGEMNLDMSNMMGDMKHETPGEPPMAATRNFIVVLSPNHLLIVPGNDYVLYEAVRRWEWVKTQYLPPEPPPTPEQLEARRKIPPYMPTYGNSAPLVVPREESTQWHASWNSICAMISHPDMHALRFAGILTPSEALNTLDFASQTYGFEVKDELREQIPADLPPLLSVYTTTPATGCTFTTIPHEMSRAQFQRLIQSLPQMMRK